MQLGVAHDRRLDEILAGVSRSFYLSLAVLPKAVRPQMSVAYLVARAADTIADTELVPRARRLSLLGELRRAVLEGGRAGQTASQVIAELSVAGGIAAERALLEQLERCLEALDGFEIGDRERARTVLTALITGMETELERVAADGEVAALETMEELERYCYHAAGCVGEFWTTMTAAHIPALGRLARPDFVARGCRLGKALQLVNVLRDAPRDFASGRCYLPRALLQPLGVRPEQLGDPSARRLARPALDRVRARALEHVDGAWPYVLATPATQPRLRLAAVWPLWIGLETLALLRDQVDPLDPARPAKIRRGDVYRIIATSTAAVGSDRLLTRLHEQRRVRAA